MRQITNTQANKRQQTILANASYLKLHNKKIQSLTQTHFLIGEKAINLKLLETISKVRYKILKANFKIKMIFIIYNHK